MELMKERRGGEEERRVIAALVQAGDLLIAMQYESQKSASTRARTEESIEAGYLCWDEGGCEERKGGERKERRRRKTAVAAGRGEDEEKTFRSKLIEEQTQALSMERG